MDRYVQGLNWQECFFMEKGDVVRNHNKLFLAFRKIKKHSTVITTFASQMSSLMTSTENKYAEIENWKEGLGRYAREGRKVIMLTHCLVCLRENSIVTTGMIPAMMMTQMMDLTAKILLFTSFMVRETPLSVTDPFSAINFSKLSGTLN